MASMNEEEESKTAVQHVEGLEIPAAPKLAHNSSGNENPMDVVSGREREWQVDRQTAAPQVFHASGRSCTIFSARKYLPVGLLRTRILRMT